MKLKRRMSKRSNANELSVAEHMSELRMRVHTVIISLILASLICLLYSDAIICWFIELGGTYGYAVVSLAAQETVIQKFKVAMMSAFIICLPLLAYELIAFIAPIFDSRFFKLKMMLIEVLVVVLAVVGGLFVIKCLFPVMMTYFVSVSSEVNIQMTVSLESLITLVYSILGYMSLAFELPVVCILLCKYRVISIEILKGISGVVNVGIFIIAAIITPPDVVSQILVAGPLVLLYQVSILLCRVYCKCKRGE